MFLDEYVPYPGHDPLDPPPGAAPAACQGCQGTGRTWREYKALGPLRAIDLEPGEVGSVPVLGRCRHCRGHGWTWGTSVH